MAWLIHMFWYIWVIDRGIIRERKWEEEEEVVITRVRVISFPNRGMTQVDISKWLATHLSFKACAVLFFLPIPHSPPPIKFSLKPTRYPGNEPLPYRLTCNTASYSSSISQCHIVVLFNVNWNFSALSLSTFHLEFICFPLWHSHIKQIHTQHIPIN